VNSRSFSIEGDTQRGDRRIQETTIMKNRHLALSLLLAAGCAKSTPEKVEAGYHPTTSTTIGQTSSGFADGITSEVRDSAAPYDTLPDRPPIVAPLASDRTSSPSTDVRQTPADSAISDRVRQAILGDGTISMLLPNIHVLTTRGVVALTGSVRSPADKQQIEMICKGVGGVARVDNRLDVKTDLAKSAAGASNPPDASGSATPGPSDADAAISQRITRAILDDATVAVEAPSVKVATSNGAVTLSGTVKSQTSKERIETIAKSIAGSTRVEDNIEIAPDATAPRDGSTESPPDRAISEKVRQVIRDDGTVSMDAPTVIVATVNGVVTLTGSVSRPANKPRIETLARDVVGVTSVDDQIEVKDDSTVTASEESPADRAISEKVRKAIGDDATIGTEAQTVKVQTERGVVTLSGSVKSLINKRRVEILAVGVTGVTRVENKLDVKSG
jgi:hyperosmotically inducible protein